MQDRAIDARPSDEPPGRALGNAIIGVDVAKAAFVVARHGAKATQAVANSLPAIQAWLKALPAGACIAMESTGRYHLELASQAKAAGFSVYVLNAMDVHHYAKAMGQRGKTDPLDAHLIAQYVAHQLLGQARKRLRPWEPTPKLLAELRELHRARVQLADSCARLSMALEHVAALEEEAHGLRAHFKKLMAQIDAKVALLMASDTQLVQGHKRLQSITGVGPQGAALLATLLARVEFDNSDAVVAYAGLDPRPEDSGNKRGRRRLSKKGDPHLRRQLYLCAMAATRSALFRPMYEALRGRGLPSTAALVVLARKLLRIAFAVWRSGQAFDPSKLMISAKPA
ncbi:MAG: IS110 family transposase [Polaromonas sp.]|uniref:IS110 family transposase n=1 Tax=Polaromonas sp. TaxID=1869339 RepID=UPI002732FB69|nr:IS110 family transposase [Polaromonas sp.]MDP3247345.1 IS110 family transposase [Polaromonas sp.]